MDKTKINQKNILFLIGKGYLYYLISDIFLRNLYRPNYPQYKSIYDIYQQINSKSYLFLGGSFYEKRVNVNNTSIHFYQKLYDEWRKEFSSKKTINFK